MWKNPLKAFGNNIQNQLNQNQMSNKIASQRIMTRMIHAEINPIDLLYTYNDNTHYMEMWKVKSNGEVFNLQFIFVKETGWIETYKQTNL